MEAIFLPLDSISQPTSYDFLLPYISPQKRTHIATIHNTAQQQLSLLSDILIRVAACKTLRCQNHTLSFCKKAQGKPYLVNNPSFEFNISHTKNAIFLAFGETPVGVDIERDRIIRPEIVHRFFLQNEQAYIFSQTPLKNQRIIEVWTRKEAYTKLTGKGMAACMSCADTMAPDFSPFFSTTREESYTMTVCTYQQELLHFHKMELQELFQNLSNMTPCSE